MRPVISCYQAAALLRAREQGLTAARGSFDLGLGTVEVSLDGSGVSSPTAPTLAWSAVEHVAATESVCFGIDETGAVSPLRIFSEAADRSFQLWPTSTSPALLISGFLMHRIRDVAPDEGAKRMVRALGKVHGRVLDTTTGLGYAAIAAARIATHVVTIEVEPAVRELARQNPWSRDLFENRKLSLLDGDSARVVPTLEAGSFSAILHDPPAINLAGELYSAAFYGSLHRALARGGRLFHYIGDADSPSGSRTTRGVVKRLHEAGFSRVTIIKDSFGVLASA